MNVPDSEESWEAMQIEYAQLQNKKAWVIVEKKRNFFGSTWM